MPNYVFKHTCLVVSLFVNIYPSFTWNNIDFPPLISGYYNDVIICAMESEITSVSIICSTVCSEVDQRKHQSSASLAFVRGIHRSPVDYPHKGSVTHLMTSWWSWNGIDHSKRLLRTEAQISCNIENPHCIIHLNNVSVMACLIIYKYFYRLFAKQKTILDGISESVMCCPI